MGLGIATGATPAPPRRHPAAPLGTTSAPPLGTTPRHHLSAPPLVATARRHPLGPPRSTSAPPRHHLAPPRRQSMRRHFLHARSSASSWLKLGPSLPPPERYKSSLFASNASQSFRRLLGSFQRYFSGNRCMYRFTN
jgi:hypothetical protein